MLQTKWSISIFYAVYWNWFPFRYKGHFQLRPMILSDDRENKNKTRMRLFHSQAKCANSTDFITHLIPDFMQSYSTILMEFTASRWIFPSSVEPKESWIWNSELMYLYTTRSWFGSESHRTFSEPHKSTLWLYLRHSKSQCNGK